MKVAASQEMTAGLVSVLVAVKTEPTDLLEHLYK